MFRDPMGKQIAGYRYGDYWFNAGKKISALCGVKYSSECELVRDWDSVHGPYQDVPRLVRIYTDGEEKQLRPIPDEIVTRLLQDLEGIPNAQSVHQI